VKDATSVEAKPTPAIPVGRQPDVPAPTATPAETTQEPKA